MTTKRSQTSEREQIPDDPERLVEKVRERYADIVTKSGSCCGEAPCGPPTDEAASRLGYDVEELRQVPDGANLGVGCGAPVGRLDLKSGEVALDLGSGAGLDAFLAARRVGAGGRVIGVDMTPEMIDRARENAQKAGFDQVEFRQGRLEALPVEDASVDAVTSNCVINLVPDKEAVFREVARVLKPGGRMVVSDIVLDGELPDVVARDLLAYSGCVAGAMRREDYLATVRSAGFSEVEILEDGDFLLAVQEAVPDDIAALAKQHGVKLEELQGVVSSVMLRAVKPAHRS